METLFFTILLEVSIGKGLGALKGLVKPPPSEGKWCHLCIYRRIVYPNKSATEGKCDSRRSCGSMKIDGALKAEERERRALCAIKSRGRHIPGGGKERRL